MSLLGNLFGNNNNTPVCTMPLGPAAPAYGWGGYGGWGGCNAGWNGGWNGGCCNGTPVIDAMRQINIDNQFGNLNAGIVRTEATAAFNTQQAQWNAAAMDTKLECLNANITAQTRDAIAQNNIQNLNRQLLEKDMALQTAQILGGVGAIVNGAVASIQNSTAGAIGCAANNLSNQLSCCCESLKATLSGDNYVKAATLTIPQTVTTATA